MSRSRANRRLYSLNVTRRTTVKHRDVGSDVGLTPWAEPLFFGEERTLREDTASAGPGDRPLAGISNWG